jgi:hypothetical protein
MGICANYIGIANEDIIKLKSDADLAEIVYASEEGDYSVGVNIDKMWDALHFLLVGTSAIEIQEKNIVSMAIIGKDTITEGEDFVSIAVNDKNSVRQIAKKLKNIDIHLALENDFDMQKFSDNDIYPDIWDFVDEEDEIKDDLKCCYENLYEFYYKMAKENIAVFVMIT